MSIGENLQYLRKQKNMTQEQLAEALEVSRQSVSKWESENSFPEMEKLLQICQMFHCNMDALLQGDVKDCFKQDSADYNGHMKKKAVRITFGVVFILSGLSVMQYLSAFGVVEDLATIVFLLFTVVAVVVFVITGMEDDYFKKKHPIVEDFYTEQEKDACHRQFTVLIATGVGICIAAVIVLLGLEQMIAMKAAAAGGSDALRQLGPFAFATPEQADNFGTAVFLTLIAGGVGCFVYGGLTKSRYDIAAYNKETVKNPEEKKTDDRIGAYCGCIMIAATIIYLLLGFLQNLWGIAWVVFPVGGLLCGITTLLLNLKQHREE